jgi:hypothetical protein
MRIGVWASAVFLLLTGAAEAQNCNGSWARSLQCSDGSSLTRTWNGGYQSGGGTTCNQNQLGNGYDSSAGGSLRRNSLGNITSGGGMTYSVTPLDSGIRSSTGNTCTRELLDNVVCR